MKSSLVSREVIADFRRAHDARTLLRRAGRHRGLRQEPARHDDVDAAAQCSSVFLYGGSIMPGKFKGRDVTVVDIFEGVGMFSAGRCPPPTCTT